jgi:DNA-directed RNA polymerase subunit M/transcription elongation factor TFIIS
MSIICSDDDDKAYCDKCDYLLVPSTTHKDMMVCTNCESIYDPQSNLLHRQELKPEVSVYDSGPEFVAMDQYTQPKSKKPTVGEYEDRRMTQKKSGFRIIEAEEW